jgi:dethiobiotin synthetase
MPDKPPFGILAASVTHNKVKSNCLHYLIISMHGVFITGTDTGIGKTIVAAGIARLLKKNKIDVTVMKPFATGASYYSKKYRSEDTAMLANAAEASELDEELNPSFFKIPASPLMAAQILKQDPPDTKSVLFALKELGKRHQFVVVEGIGGLMVPLTEQEYVADFIKATGLAVVIVTRPSLGTLNHTLLTVGMCRKYGLEILGIVINMMPSNPTRVEKNTPDTIKRLASVPILAILPEMKTASYDKVATLLEREKALDKIYHQHCYPNHGAS